MMGGLSHLPDLFVLPRCLILALSCVPPVPVFFRFPLFAAYSIRRIWGGLGCVSKIRFRRRRCSTRANDRFRLLHAGTSRASARNQLRQRDPGVPPEEAEPARTARALRPPESTTAARQPEPCTRAVCRQE